MSFSSYWKEIAVLLAGLFAIGSVLADVKDKKTGKVTIWGRAFFGLTVLSMIGGFYAQWVDTTAEEKRNKDVQGAMLAIQQRTEKSVLDLSRLLQPIDSPRVALLLTPNCELDKMKAFCTANKTRGDLEAKSFKIPSATSFDIHKPDWSGWPKENAYSAIGIRLFKNSRDAARQLNRCAQCSDGGDMTFTILMSTVTPSKPSQLSLSYEAAHKSLTMEISEFSVRPNMRSDKLLSVIDVPGSTIVISASSGLFEIAPIDLVYMLTPRGQTINAGSLTREQFGSATVFTYHFADSGSKPPGAE